MKTATACAILAGICLLNVSRAQTRKGGGTAARSPDLSLSATLDWMAQTYNFTEGKVHSSGVTINKQEMDASLTHQGCRLTVSEKDVTFQTSDGGRTDTSELKRVFDLADVDGSSIRLRPTGGGKVAYFALEFASAGEYKSFELFADEVSRPATFRYGSIFLFAGHNGYASRFADAFRRAVKLCREKQAAL